MFIVFLNYVKAQVGSDKNSMQLDSTGLVSPTVKYTIGEWGHYVVTVNASRFIIYQNGVSVLHKWLSAPLEHGHGRLDECRHCIHSHLQ